MKTAEINTRALRFYSRRSIGLATFLGGPLAAGYLIRENFMALDKSRQGNNALLLGTLATVAMMVGLSALPESGLDVMPPQLIPLIYTGIIYFIVEKIHGPLLKQHREHGYAFFSRRKAAGVGVISLLLLVIAIVGYDFVVPSSRDYEIYDSKMTRFSRNEETALKAYEQASLWGDFNLIKELEATIIPKWKENVQIIEEVMRLPDIQENMQDENSLLLEYSRLRVASFLLIKKAMDEHTRQYDGQIGSLTRRMNGIIEEIKEARK